MGLHHLSRLELASFDLAVACPRLADVRPRSRGPSRDQPTAACAECRAAVLGAGAGDWPRRSQRSRSGAVRASSYQCGVGGLAGGAQEPAQYAVPAADHGGLPALRQGSARRTVRRGVRPVRARADGQAADYRSAISAAAVGLLAAGAPAAAAARKEGRAAVSSAHGKATAAGESSAARVVRRQRRGHPEGAEIRRSSAVADPLPLLAAGGERGHRLCALSGEDGVAGAAGAAVSVLAHRAAAVAIRNGAGGIGGNHHGGVLRAQAALPHRGLAMVSRRAGSHDRTGAGGRAVHGRSLRICLADRYLPDGELGGGRLGRPAPLSRRWVAAAATVVLLHCPSSPGINWRSGATKWIYGSTPSP